MGRVAWVVDSVSWKGLSKLLRAPAPPRTAILAARAGSVLESLTPFIAQENKVWPRIESFQSVWPGAVPVKVDDLMPNNSESDRTVADPEQV